MFVCEPLVDERLADLRRTGTDHAERIEVERARLVRIRRARRPRVAALLPRERLDQLRGDLLREQAIRLERIEQVETDERVGEPAAEVVHHRDRALQRLRRQRLLLEQEVTEPLALDVRVDELRLALGDVRLLEHAGAAFEREHAGRLRLREPIDEARAPASP